MWRATRKLVAGLRGAAGGLIIAIALCAITAMAPTVAVSLASRGTIDMDTFFPRSRAARSQSMTVSIEGLPEERRAVLEALNSLVWPVRSPGLKIVITAAKSLPPDAVATYDFLENVISISEEVMADPDGQGLSHILAHEIGHELDGQYLDESGRAEFRRTRGHDSRQSWDGAGVAWQDSPQEDFAEVFAVLDAPFSQVAIQTNAGRIKDLKGMEEFVSRYQEGAIHVQGPTHELTLLPLAKTLVRDYTTQPDALVLGLVIAVMCSAIGAAHSMRRSMRCAWAPPAATRRFRHH